MQALAKTPEAQIDQIMAQLNELEQITGMSGATAASIISHCKAELAALRRLSVTQRYQHAVRSNQQTNCRELYARHPVPAQLRLLASPAN
jgi:hypothetical protein